MKKLYVLIAMLVCIQATAQSPLADSLIQQLKRTDLHDTTRIKYYGDISWEMLQHDIKASLSYAKKELSLAEKTQRKADMAQAYSDIGNIYNIRSSYDTALVFYQKGLDLRVNLKQFDKAAGICNNMATALMKQSKFDKALELNFKALKMFETIHDTIKQSRVLANVAIIYNRLNQEEEAMNFLRRAAFLLKNKNQPMYEANVWLNMGTTKFAVGVNDTVTRSETDLDSALYFYGLAQNVYEKLKARHNLSAIYNDIGKIHAQRKQYDQAISYYLQALEIKKEFQDADGIYLGEFNIGELCYMTGRNAEAIQHLLAAVQGFEAINDLVHLKNSYFTLVKLYSRQSDFKKALEYYDKYTHTYELVYSRQHDDALLETKTRYETEKKDLEIKKARTEAELLNEKAQLRNIIIVSLIALFILTGVAGFNIYRKRQLRLKAEMDAKISQERDERARAVIEAEERERVRIARDLHDGVGQLLSAAQLNLGSLERSINGNDENQKTAYDNALSLINDSVKEVRTVSHQMMPNTLLKLGLVSAIREFVTRLKGTPHLKVNLEVMGVEKRISPEKENVIYRTIQEVVNNVVKHAKAKVLSMQMIGHENELTIMIEDDGVGFDVNAIQKADGIGLRNIITRMEFINGRIHFDSTPGKGTTVVIEVPY